LTYEPGWLSFHGQHLPGGEVRVHYSEAYCLAGSTDADWIKHTVVGHVTEPLKANADRTRVKLRDTLSDGVIVEHTITASGDEVEFRLEARNPSEHRSEAHWAQPCARLAEFTGFDPSGPDIEDYLPKCFVVLDGQLVRMPTETWATQARYTPGQVWCPRGVPRSDVNPRPLSELVPSHGLIGAFSGEESLFVRKVVLERSVMAEPTFDHERLEVYRLSIEYVAFSFRIATSLGGVNRQTRDPWLRAAQSIPLIIAEGNGKQSLRDKNRFFEIARGSALECSAIHDVLRVCDAITDESNTIGKSNLKRIVSMLTRRIQRTDNVAEDRIEYEYEYRDAEYEYDPNHRPSTPKS
jgi:four helix bundle protein